MFDSSGKDSMNWAVSALWGLYIIVVVGTFVILWLLLGMAQRYYTSLGYDSAFLVASVLGAIAVFIGTAWLDPNQFSSTDKPWLTVLFIMAFVLPIVVILYILWAG